MRKFKILFPSGYFIDNFENDNIDINVVFEDHTVYVATAFTLVNIRLLMGTNNYFWASDMFIVSDLRKETLKKAINEAIKNEYFELIFNKIGDIQQVYECNNFDEIKDIE